MRPTLRYPFSFPQVFETAGKIPVNIDWHVYPDGHFCLCTVPEEIFKCKNGIILSNFMEEEVKPYLFNQTHRRLRGFYINERAHGVAGELEFYVEVLGTKDKQEIKRFFQFVLKRDEPQRTKLRFCGSGSKYRKCHRDQYRKFVLLDDNELQTMSARLVEDTDE